MRREPPHAGGSAGIVGPPRRAPRLIVSACGLLAALVLLEVVTRVEGPPVCAGRASLLLAPDPEVGWTFAPGVTFTLDPCAPAGARRLWSTPVAINSHGLHDQEWAYAKRPDQVRVLLLGNETADGIGVARADRLSVRISHLADRRRGRRVSVINATLPGYGPHEELRFVERRGLRYEPDLVVLLVDPERDLAASLHPPEARPAESTFPPASGLLDLSGTVRWLRGRPAGAPETAVAITEPPAPAGEDERARARARLVAIVRRMAEASRAAGARFAVAIAPRCPRDGGADDLCAALEDVAPCVDLRPVFADLDAAAPGEAQLCIPGQPRWGRDAHFLASHKIWDLLAERGLWPDGVVRGHRL